jgi:hypothetical protein
MGKPASIDVESDRALIALPTGDFIAGLVSETDKADLPQGACSDCSNVYFRPGRILKRAGYVVRNTLSASADGVNFFYDSSGAMHIVAWANGNFYEIDSTSYAITLIQAGAYTKGLRVCSAVLARILYFSDGETIFGGVSGIRSYDPVGTPGSAPAVITSGGAGTIATPACKVMIARYGALLLGRIKYVGGTYAKDSVMWTNVLDPTTIIGSNIYRVGDGQGGEVNSLQIMSTAKEGIAPDAGVFCGLSQYGCYLLNGALSVSSLTDIQLNVTAGVLDGATVKYLPAEGAAFVVFLATDRKVYATNGVDTIDLSKGIVGEMGDYIAEQYAIAAGSSTVPRFTAARDFNNHMYYLDLGGKIYVYDWNYKYWTKYDGWRSGYWIEGFDRQANPTLYVVDKDSADFIEQSIGTLDDTNASDVWDTAIWDTNGWDGTTAVTPLWKGQWLSGGDGDLNKIFKYGFLSFKTDVGNITLSAQVNHGTGPSATTTYSPTSAAGITGTADTWDFASWGSGTFDGAGSSAIRPYKQKNRLFVQNVNGTRGKLQGHDVQLTISQSEDGHFEVLNTNILYLPGGRRHIARGVS